ncbi:MAG: SdpI family protein [Dehalococcoidia bacterium]|nr:SdpI family protein [Dehalococcoidia bacterium]
MDLAANPLQAIGLLHIAAALVFAGLGLPLARGQTPMNPWYGARFPQAYRSPRHWYAINRYAGRRMIAFGAVLSVTGVVGVVVGNADPVTIALFAAAPGAAALLVALDAYLYAARFR